ncbi:MAG: hypothetical protein FJX60_17740 [Alphaproteobacteria bacterium]|nr:hypothetical protein [Alphaproteobacteria bacterium]
MLGKFAIVVFAGYFIAALAGEHRIAIVLWIVLFITGAAALGRHIYGWRGAIYWPIGFICLSGFLYLLLGDDPSSSSIVPGRWRD